MSRHGAIRVSVVACVGSLFSLHAAWAGKPNERHLSVAAVDQRARSTIALSCAGDCDGDGIVAIEELVRGVGIALGTTPPKDCAGFDGDRNGQVTIDELVAAVRGALRGCEAGARTPTAAVCTRGMVGRVLAEGTDAAVTNARVTVQSVDGNEFREVRSDAAGRYEIPNLAPGCSLLGASALGLEYVERPVELLGETCARADLALGPETSAGRWQIVGDPGEAFGGTDSGVLLPDGRLLWCHDTIDPVIFDPTVPAAARFFFPPKSPRIQGCHAVGLTADGQALYVGGADQPVYGPGTRQVKRYDPVANSWRTLPSDNELVDPRWYPSMAPLPDGGFIAVGGGGLANPVRVNTSEVLDPQTMRWRRVGDVALGNEVSPIVLLFSGEVLMTHRPPQLYNPQSERWRPAADFVQGNRSPNGEHADHEIVMLSDGRVVAIGYKSYSAEPGNMVEIYDPGRNDWRLGANVRPVRSRASILQLPDERVLVLGGEKEEPEDPTPTNAWGQVALTDLYDPTTDTWRRLADLNVAREYHALPILIPDGRIVVIGGEEAPGQEPARSTIEIFEPPYLFRGPRPRIADLTGRTFRRGESIRFRVERTAAPTRVGLLGTVATTHFMDSGPARYVALEFEQDGDEIRAHIPAEPARAIPGFYLLFVLVDDIPSEGIVLQVTR